jgi:hypothetical protein
MKLRHFIFLVFGGLISVAASAAQPGLIIVSADPTSFTIADPAGPKFHVNLVAWGPAWAWTGWDGKVTPGADGAGQYHLTTRLGTGATLTLDVAAKLDQQNHLVLNYTLTSDKDTDLTQVCAALMPDPAAFPTGQMVATKADGTNATSPLPLALSDVGTGNTALKFSSSTGLEISALLDPPAKVTIDGGAARVSLATGHLAASQPVKQTITLVVPGTADFYATAASAPDALGIEKWYPFTPEIAGKGNDELSLAGWLDAPAGKQGRIKSDGANLVYGGKQIRLWGIDVCYGDCSPPKDLADRRADFYARNGINAVRLHKYADNPDGMGIQSDAHFAQLDPAGLDRMDYFISKLKEKGIYVELSATFGVKLGQGDRAAVPYMDEFGAMSPGPGGRIATPNGSIYLSSELQDQMIKQTTNLLAHKNPYTGLTYAEDADIASIELFNEDSALFFGTMTDLQHIPTLRTRTDQRFTRWLKARYGTKEALLAAWGPQSLNTFVAEGLIGEDWDKETIVPAGNPWFFDPDQLAGAMAPRKQRLLDTMRFLYEVQNDFYERYAKAIHAAGYTGELVASNWQAGRAFSHFYNLNSDARIGIVDRHNYFGSLEGSMIATPGSGILSSGMMQVANRPFMLSEWISTFPSEFAVEAPALIGAYGMGLQGWDVSFEFQNGDQAMIEPVLGNSPWEVMAPQNIGVFPAVARQVLRGDVKTSDLLAPRYVNVPSLEKGQLGFDDSSAQAGDVKTFNSATVPAASLAVARCVVDFTDTPRATDKFDPSKYIKDGAYVSSTGQLRWHPAPDGQAAGGWFTIDTPGTQAVVGFAAGQRLDLTDVTIQPSTNFGAIYLTAQEADQTLASTHAMLVVALGRARNTGMKIAGGEMLDKGKAPILLEPIAATLTLKRQGNPTVYLLDHSGHRTGATLPVTNGQVMIDGARDKTPYYLIAW